MKDERRGISIVRIVIIVILLLLLGGLFVIHRQTSREKSLELQKRSEEIREEQKAKEMAETEKADLYHKMIADLGVRDLVMWGDEDMVGTEAGSLIASVSGRLYDRLADGVTDLFPNAVNYEEEALEAEKAENPDESGSESDSEEEITGPRFTYNVYDMGIINEGMQEIFARAGIVDVKTKAWMRIPSSTEAADLELVDSSFKTLFFAAQTPPKFGTVTLAGVDGILSSNGSYDDLHPRFDFVRSEEGDAVSVQAGTPVYFESVSKYDDCVPVLFFDEETVTDPGTFLDYVNELVASEDFDPSDDGEGDTSEDDEADSAGEEEDPEAGEAAETGAEEEEESDTGELEEGSDAGSTGPAPEVEEGGAATDLSGAFVIICTTQEGSELDEALSGAFGDRYIRNDTARDNMTAEDYDLLADQVLEQLDRQGYFKGFNEAVRKAEDALQ